MKSLRLVMIVAFVVTLTAPSFAALPEPINKSVHKIHKGIVDLVNIPYGIGKGTYDETKSASFKPFGLVGGLLKSSADGAKKAVTAAVDIATFPLEMVKK